MFGRSKIPSVAAIMKPLMVTRDKLVKARDARNDAITSNVKRIKDIEVENIMHAAEASAATNMIDGLNAQLKPLEGLKK